MHSSRGSGGGGYVSGGSRRRGQELAGKAFAGGQARSRHVVIDGHSNKGGSGGDHVVVGNLPWDASWQELKDLARQCCANNGGADVLRADVPVNDAGRSRGFGVLEFASAADAATAIRSMNGVEFKGRVLEVREDRRGGGSGGAAPQTVFVPHVRVQHAAAPPPMAMTTTTTTMMMMQPPTNTRVFVSNLAYEVQWQDLKDLMKRVGSVVRADVFTDGSGRSKGSGLVEFSHPAEAALAIQTMQNAELRGRPIMLREDRDGPAAHHGVGGGGVPASSAHHGHVVQYAGPSSHHPSGGVSSGSVGTRVYIGNLAWDVAWQDLKDHIRGSGFPSVLSVDVLMEAGAGGRSKGCAIARFPDTATAAAAIAGLNNTELHGRQMFVREDREEGNR